MYDRLLETIAASSHVNSICRSSNG